MLMYVYMNTFVCTLEFAPCGGSADNRRCYSSFMRITSNSCVDIDRIFKTSFVCQNRRTHQTALMCITAHSCVDIDRVGV